MHPNDATATAPRRGDCPYCHSRPGEGERNCETLSEVEDCAWANELEKGRARQALSTPAPAARGEDYRELTNEEIEADFAANMPGQMQAILNCLAAGGGVSAAGCGKYRMRQEADGVWLSEAAAQWLATEIARLTRELEEAKATIARQDDELQVSNRAHRATGKLLARTERELEEARDALDLYRQATAKALMEGCGNPLVWGDELLAAQQNAAKFIRQRPSALSTANRDAALAESDLENLWRLSRLSADEVAVLPAWAVSRFCDIHQIVTSEFPRTALASPQHEAGP